MKSIIYSLPTIYGGEIQYVMPTEKTFEGAPQFYEDDWLQLEFYPIKEINSIKQELIKISTFRKNNETKSGWKNIYIRKIPHSNFKIKLSYFNNLNELRLMPSPILTTSSRPIGQVENGFSVILNNGILLYGIRKQNNILSLAVLEHSIEENYNDEILNVLAKLNIYEKLFLVDWVDETIIIIDNNKTDIWHPLVKDI